jgi:formate hydrogenlyase subunit 6/NADH:ubiquinone oxidoreductase subunit I
MKEKPGFFIPELLRHVFKKPVTVDYPFEKIDVPKGFRGTVGLTPELCIVCRSCERDCPAEAIEISVVSEEEKKFKMVIHNDRCIHCAQCVEVCPTNAMTINTKFELSEPSRWDMKFTYVYPRAQLKKKTGNPE